MDGLDLFRKLGVGAKFNFNRFQKDAEKLHLKRKVSVRSEFGAEREEQDDDSDVAGAPVQTPVAGSATDVAKRKREEDVSSSDDDSDEDNKEEEQELYLIGSMKSNTTANVEGVVQRRQKKPKRNKKVHEKLKAELSQERVNQFRNKNKIHTYGTDVPDPISSFVDLQKIYKLQSVIMTNVKSLGFEGPTPIQMQAISVMMNRREILACAPTGSGKTLAFILPILHQLQCPQNKGFRALVLSPTRELATQTHREFMRLAEGTGFRVHLIEKSTNAQKKFGPRTKQNFDILVTTPNRLVHLLRQDPPHVSLSNVEWLVVDESDKLFEDGKTGFRDQIATIYQACDGNNVRRAMFSATFAHEVEEWCKLNLDSLVQVYIGTTNSATDTIKQELVFVGSESGKLLAVQDMVRKGLQPPVLIFVQSKDRAKELFHELIYDGINVDVIHADRTQTQRDNIIKQFRAGNIWILICTELMGRGIDFKGVNLVINYDFPTSAISYIHRIGRTGRAGMSGTAITFFTENDVPNLRTIANVMKSAGCPVPEYMLRLKKKDRRERRKMAKSNPKRATIRTIPKRDIQQAKKRNKLKKKVQNKHDGTI